MCFLHGGEKHEESIITTQLLGIDFLYHNDLNILDCMPERYIESVLHGTRWWVVTFWLYLAWLHFIMCNFRFILRNNTVIRVHIAKKGLWGLFESSLEY